MLKPSITFLLLAPAAAILTGAEFPEAEISNREIRAKFHLPDAQKGYYRGTRFEWSGQINSLQYKGHDYFGQWNEKYDPKLHDAIMGPVEEFRTGNSSLGYEAAKPGETFIRIGVGAVRKPEEKGYRTFNTYEIVDHGKWKVKKGRDRIEFTHELKDASGYAYVYRKVVRLVKDKPVMVLEHSLKNTGRLPIDTLQYNHNFFVIDKQPTGPGAVVKFAFDAMAKADLKGMARVEGRELVYLKELERGQSVYSELAGFGNTARDYDFRIEHRKAGAGVRFTGDQPLVRLIYWSIRTTLCPEPYIQIQVPPGAEKKWNITYEFYTLP